MDGAAFEKIITKLGAENILGLLFDNSAVRMFYDNKKFDMATNYDADIECLKFQEFDQRGQVYWVYKSVADIQGFVVRDEKIPFNSYDRIALRG